MSDTLSDRIKKIVHAFSDADRKRAVREIASSVEALECENAAQKAALAKASASLSAFLGFHSGALPLEAVRGLSDLVREIQPFLKP